MHLTFVSYLLSVYVPHRPEQLTPEYGAILTLHPEVLCCLGCGQCIQACPQELDVRHLIALIERGKLERAALGSFWQDGCTASIWSRPHATWPGAWPKARAACAEQS